MRLAYFYAVVSCRLFLGDDRPIVVAGRGDGALVLDVLDHQRAHLAVIAVLAHGVEDDFRLPAIRVCLLYTSDAADEL